MEVLKEYSKEVLNIDDEALKELVSNITNERENKVRRVKEILGVSELRAREIILKEEYGIDIKDLDKAIEGSERYFRKEILKRRQETLKLEVIK